MCCGPHRVAFGVPLFFHYNLEKIEVLHIGHQREELDIELEGKILNQRDSFVYLGGAVCGDGKTERETYVEDYRPQQTRGEQLRG